MVLAGSRPSLLRLQVPGEPVGLRIQRLAEAFGLRRTEGDAAEGSDANFSDVRGDLDGDGDGSADEDVTEDAGENISGNVGSESKEDPEDVSACDDNEIGDNGAVSYATSHAMAADSAAAQSDPAAAAPDGASDEAAEAIRDDSDTSVSEAPSGSDGPGPLPASRDQGVLVVFECTGRSRVPPPAELRRSGRACGASWSRACECASVCVCVRAHVSGARVDDGLHPARAKRVGAREKGGRR